jgi:hypothetical protein
MLGVQDVECTERRRTLAIHQAESALNLAKEAYRLAVSEPSCQCDACLNTAVNYQRAWDIAHLRVARAHREQARVNGQDPESAAPSSQITSAALEVTASLSVFGQAGDDLRSIALAPVMRSLRDLERVVDNQN